MADGRRVLACGSVRPILTRLPDVILVVVGVLVLAAGAGPAHAATTHMAQRPGNARTVAENAGPGRTIVSQIHNAPGWRPSYSYTDRSGPHTRVVNGPGWNDASATYNPGKRLDAYQLISHGSCVSGRSEGPAGTGSDIADGTCRWKYLSRVDYISITGWAFDNRHWESGTAYRYGDYVVSDSPLRAYEQVRGAGCTSTVAPTGTANGSGSAFTTSDGCQWKYWADVIYSSGRSYIPTQRYAPGSTSSRIDELTANHQADLWNDREYVAGRHGEAVPIRLQAHHDHTQDGFPYSPEGGRIACPSGCREIIVTTAPGESFADSLTPGDPLSGYDPARGVAIRNPTTGYLTDGFELRDNHVTLIGLQIKSDHGIGLGGGETHGGNYATVRRSTIDGGQGHKPAIFLDTRMLVANSLVVAHGAFGIQEDYPGTVLHSTLVNPDRVPDSFGIVSGHDWVFVGETVSNTAIFGFAHAAGFGFQGWDDMTWLGSHNATDAPAADNGSPALPRKGRVIARMLPGTTYGESASKAFVAFPGDYRPRAGSPLIGAGNALGAFNPACPKHPKHKPCRAIYTLDLPDIIGTPRPQAGRYDIGAWQSGPVPPQAAAVPARTDPSGAATAVASWTESITSAVHDMGDSVAELQARIAFVVSKAAAKARSAWGD